MIVRYGCVAGVGGVKEIPCEHFLFSTLGEILRGVWHGEECQLPVLIEVPGWRRAPYELVSEIWKRVFGESHTLHEWAVPGRESCCRAAAFVMGEDVGFGDVQKIEDAFQIFTYRLRGIVVVSRDGGLRCASKIHGDDGVVLRKNWANGMKGQLLEISRVVWCAWRPLPTECCGKPWTRRRGGPFPAYRKWILTSFNTTRWCSQSSKGIILAWAWSHRAPMKMNSSMNCIIPFDLASIRAAERQAYIWNQIFLASTMSFPRRKQSGAAIL